MGVCQIKAYEALKKMKKGREKQMKIRITGTSKEAQQLAELLPAIMKVSSVSGEYPNRVNSNEVRVYVDGVVEENPFTMAMQKYAKVRNQLEALFMVTVTSEGQFLQANVAINKRGFLVIMNHLASEDFAQTLKENMENFLQGKTHIESEDPKNAS